MTDTLKKGDFIEIEFTGKLKDTGEIFDSNVKENLKKMNFDVEVKPYIYSLGNGMFLKGIDEFLIGKPIPKKPVEYTIELSPEKAFGKKNPELIQTISIRVFKSSQTKPYPGAVFSFDGKLGKVISVSGGRVVVDFNSPVAGKEVVYEIRILRKVDDVNEKAKAFLEFLFKKKVPFEIKGNNISFQLDKELIPLAKALEEKFREILGLNLELGEK